MEARKFTISNKDAKEALTKHKGLLTIWANKNRNKLWSYDEVYSIGLEGIVKAVDRFSEEKGSSIANYASIVMDTGLWDAIDSYTHALQGRREVYEQELPSVDTDLAEQAKLDLQKVLKNLTDRQKDVLVLRQIHGYKAAEVGRLLGITCQGVIDLETRAMTRLRKIYAS